MLMSPPPAPSLLPTPASANPVCKECVHTQVSAAEYTCDPQKHHLDPFKCEAGDFSGKYGSFQVGDDNWLDVTIKDR